MKLSEAIELCEELVEVQDGSHHGRALRIVLRKVKTLRAELKDWRKEALRAIESQKIATEVCAERIVELERQLAESRKVTR